MSGSPRYPTIYEINAWVWLSDLSKRHGTSLDLGSVPSAEWDAIADYGFDSVWLMGVWERSPAGIAIANQNNNLLRDFRQALPDFHPKTMWDPLIACAAMSLTSIWAAPADLPSHGRNSPNGI